MQAGGINYRKATLTYLVFATNVFEAVEPGSNPLLFPCGNLRRETIPVEMAKEGKGFGNNNFYKP